MKETICHIPVVGRMVQDEAGNWHLDAEKSEWADIPADLIARYFIEKMGGRIPGIEAREVSNSLG